MSDLNDLTTRADPVRVKICGLRDPADIAGALLAGAGYLGFVFFPKSPRFVSIPEAGALAGTVPVGICKVGLLVDPDDATLDAVVAGVPLDMIQLHGSESPARVAEVRARLGLPVMKALGVREAADLEAIPEYAKVADQLLIDAKPPKGADLPGGNGVAFDWSLITNRRFPVPWLLAGGLTPENVAQAVAQTGARQVDVSSGVESAPGEKDGAKMRDFVAAAQSGALAKTPPKLR